MAQATLVHSFLRGPHDRFAYVLAALIAISGTSVFAKDGDKPAPIAIAEVKHDGPVSFEKEILPLFAKNCLACHNAYPEIPKNPDGAFAEPIYRTPLPEGIDCQRCHGPGAAHVSQGGRGAIVNPARLSPKRQFEVCLQCHLETTSFPLPDALMNFGNAAFSFQPGKALGDYRTYFDHAPGQGRDDKFEIVSAAYRLRQSKCFLATGPEKLQCTTCHDPHGAEETNVTGICQSCHAGLKPGHPAVTADGKCEGCHMPKRRTEDVIHAVVTDHRIAKPPAQPTKLVAARTERHETGAKAYRGEVLAYYPPASDPEASADMAAVAQVVQQTNLTAGIPRLEALRQRSAEHELVLADALRAAGRLNDALPHYAKAAEDVSFIAARFAYGMALRLAGDPAKARQVLEAALQAAPNRPKGWYELGMAHLAAKDPAAARKAFDRALALDPDFVEAINARAGIAVTRGDRGAAETGIGEALKLEPGSAEARNNLGSLLLAEGRVKEALPHFEAAVQALPGHVPARYNLALALARSRRFDDARREVEAVLALDQRHAGAHQVLGALLAGQGQPREAIAHYREALVIEPDFGRALVGLAPLVTDPAEAKRLLGQALQNPDPSIRQQAAALLAHR